MPTAAIPRKALSVRKFPSTRVESMPGYCQHGRKVGEQEDRGGGRKGAQAAVHRDVLGAGSAGGGDRRRTSCATFGDCRTRIRMMTPDFTTRLNWGEKPEIRMPVFIAWMISAPTTDIGIEKRPPSSDVPPITTARIASSSSQRPALLASAPRMSPATIRPAIAAQKPAEGVDRISRNAAGNPREARGRPVYADRLDQQAKRGAAHGEGGRSSATDRRDDDRHRKAEEGARCR